MVNPGFDPTGPWTTINTESVPACRGVSRQPDQKPSENGRKRHRRIRDARPFNHMSTLGMPLVAGVILLQLSNRHNFTAASVGHSMAVCTKWDKVVDTSWSIVQLRDRNGVSDGYLSVDPKERRVMVSKRIKEEFENGRDYYKLQGLHLREPAESWAKALTENLEYHSLYTFH